VDVVGDELHAPREFGGIGDYLMRFGIAFAKRPAVIDDDVSIAGVAKAELDKLVNTLEDELFVDVLAKRVPGVPAEGRCSGIHGALKGKNRELARGTHPALAAMLAFPVPKSNGM
jgi:hypothetical protein